MADNEKEETQENEESQPIETMEDDTKDADTQPRLMIIKIVNENFKSYAGIQELGPFHKNFSSIVGPNGSGKSNVIDAMLFVFGYRSKKIRSKKVSNLIHNSGNHKNLDSCTVSVHFQRIIDLPGDDYDVVPGSEFKVSRTARKDNTSDYYLNGRKVSFKEAAKILRGCGIDLDHNRFLILQGEVEQISLMKPKAQTEHDEGMLEYLEDIIGSSRYKEPIEEFAKQVEQLNEQRGEKLNRVKAVEKEKDELEGPKNEAMEFIHLENEIVKLKNCVFQKYIYECNANEEKGKEKKDDLQKNYDELNEKLTEILQRKKAKAKEHKQVNKSHDQLEKATVETKKNFAAYERNDLKFREDLKHRRQNAKKLKKNLDKEKQTVVDLEGIPSTSEDKLAKLKTFQESLEKAKAVEDSKLEEIMAGLKNETQGIQAEKEVKEKELMELSKGVNSSKSKMDVAKSELDIYRSQQENAISKFDEAKSNLEKASEKLQDRQSDIKNIQKELPELKKKKVQAEAELKVAVEGEQKAAGELKSLRGKVEEARSSLQSAKGKGKVLDALMNQQKSGKIKGIYGRLGDLGAIDEKYDVAISTACGSLDHMVVDTMETAQKCVQFLKDNNIGSTTFIGMDKMEKFKEEAATRITTPDNAPRLIDLVKLKDEKFRTVFFFALRNTLVANDLNQATKLAYQGKRWRVISLQGALIGLQGTMTGGGTHVSKGRMGSCLKVDVSPQELSNLETKEREIALVAEQCLEAKQRLEVTVEEMSKEASKMEQNLQKFTMELQSLKDQIKELKVQVKNFEEEVKKTTPDEAKLAELQKAFSQNEKIWKKAAASATKVEEQVQALHKKIMDIGGSKLNAQQRKVDNVCKQIDEAAEEITKINVSVKTATRNKKKAEEKVVSLEKEIEENTASMEQLEKEFSKLEEEATKVLQDYQDAEKKKDEVSAVLQAIAKEYAEVEKEENELRNSEVDLKHELEEFCRVSKENHDRIKHWTAELKQMELQPEGPSGTPAETMATLETAELEELDVKAITFKITVEEQKKEQMKPNMAAIANFRKKEEAYLARVSELDKITEERDQKRKEHEDMRKKRLDEFMTGFTIITTKLKEMYQMITLGGDAELELVDSLDPFSEGIVFSVRPPKKSWKNISNLSGGEKTLSSLALVFALHHYKPTPLYVMDEIDAALDFRNVSIVANYIKERTKNAQFIIISLRNNMFELADRLIGIYKTQDCTKSVAINPKLIGKRG